MAGHHALRELYFARLREFYRQPARIFWVYGFPLVLAIGLGIAFKSRPPESFQVDLVAGPSSAAFEAQIRAHNDRAASEKKATVLLEVLPEAEAQRRLDTGQTPLVVVPQPSGPLTYRYDPTRPEAVAARSAIDQVLQVAAGRLDPIATVDRAVTEPGTRYIDFLIPGLIGLNTMGGGLWGVGFLIVNFRVAKLLKRFMATPMPRRDFLLAIFGARLTFLVPDLTVLLLLGHLMFGVPIRGSLALVVLIDVLGALAFAGIGLLIASRAESTESVSGLMNLVMLPMWLFSGVFFASTRFPKAIQPLIACLPLTQLVASLRQVMLQGAGVLEVWPALLILGGWALVTFLLALRLFKWT